MLAAAYCRVSSQEQQRRGTIDSQVRVLTDLARSLGHELFNVYTDDGRSAKAGALEARTAWTRLNVDAEAGRFKILLVVDVDRITRTDDLAERAAILGPFQRLNIPIVTPHGQLDLRTFIGDLMISLHSAMAAEERRKLLERTSRGMRTSVLKGGKSGGPAPFGLRWSKSEGWSVCEPEAALIREAHQRVARGASCPSIARTWNERGIPAPRAPTWSQFNVWHLVRFSRTRYAGTFLAHKRDSLAIPAPAILTIEEIEAAEAQLANNKRRGLEHRTTAVYLLDRGMLRCKRCGGVVGVQTAKADTHARYVCRRRTTLTVGHPDRCDAPAHLVSRIDGMLWDDLAEVILSPAYLRAALDRRRQWSSLGQIGREGEERQARTEIDRLRQVEAVVMDHGISGRLGPDVMRERLAAVRADVARHEATLARVPVEASAVTEEEVQAAVEDLRLRVASAGPAERRRIVRSTVAHVIVGDRRLRALVRHPDCRFAYGTQHRTVGELTILVA